LSLPTAIGAALRSAAPLQEVVRQQYSDVAELRVRGAIQRGDVAALELATVQFAGTEPAAVAHRWLGDRALAGGWFTTAQVEYRRGLDAAGPVLRADLQARQRLAAAMQGERLEGETHGEVAFGEYTLNAEEFERLIDEMVASRSSTAVVASETSSSAPLNPTGYRLQRRGRLDGPVGKDPSSQATPYVSRLEVDWVGRQLAVAVSDDIAYLSNRFYLSAYKLTDGSRIWQSIPTNATPLRSQDWGLIPMRPLVARDRIFLRMMYEPGTVLVCVDRASGQQRWTAEMAQGEWVISDPVMIQGQLAALTIVRQDQGANLVRLMILDADTGDIQTAYDLLRLNESWWRRRCCETLVVDDSLVVTMAGLTFRCDLSGNVRWLRRQTVLPPDEDPRWVTQYFQPPLHRGDRVYVAQPGVCSVECLDSRTGRAVWSLVLPEIQRMLGLVDDHLIVQTATQLLGIAADGGEVLWKHHLTGILHGVACDASGVLFAQPAASRRLARKEGLHLVWLDPASGDATACAALPELNVAQPRLGPLIARQDRIWTFFGRDKNEANPEILELIPEGTADVAWDPAIEPNPWTRHVPLDLLRTGRQRFPGWQLISGDIDPAGPIQAERQGRSNVFVARAEPNNPVVFTREVSIPATGQPRLRFTLGHAGVREWTIEVRLAGEVLYREEIHGRSLREPWKTTEVDLTPAAGRRGTLIIEADFRGGGESVELFWDEIEIVF
ncbi:MAG: PQQ-like beta-propeller repeat protein, partial [Planctomycetes bacterium]|nr:PQQ-like beta-propeller repeat protein [Planctomycetota bacterium]